MLDAGIELCWDDLETVYCVLFYYLIEVILTFIKVFLNHIVNNIRPIKQYEG